MRWPGNSPDLNPTENLVAIVKERVERRMITENSRNLPEMKIIFKSVMAELNQDTTLLHTLLTSMAKRVEAVVANGGGPTRF